MTEDDLKDALRIKNLKKNFGDKTAVDNVSISMFKG